MLLCLICITSCSKKDEVVDLNGIGINELIEMDIPSGYKHEKNDVFNDGGELISIHYGDGKSSIYIIILSYDGKAVMGSDETFDEWYNNKDNIVDKVSIGTDVYIYPISKNKIAKNADKSVIEGVFEYKKYLIMIGLENNEGVGDLTKEQINLFYNLLDTIKLK